MISFEKLIEEWDYDRNEGNPQINEYGYSKKVWWKCSFGHSYEMSIYNRINRHRGCPYCANQKLLTGFNDLQTVAPIIAAEWHPTKNGEVLPSQILGGGHRKVWWKCEKGHEWEAQIVSRIKQNVGCPYCSGRYAIQGENDLKTVAPELALDWDYERNGELIPDMFKVNSHKKVWWVCKQCRHSWQAIISDRYNGNGCPSCSVTYRTSAPEQLILFYLKQYYDDVIGSYKPKWLSGSSEIDIFIPCKNIGIEYDGSAWHQDIEKDIRKNKLCAENGIMLIRIREDSCPELDILDPIIYAGKYNSNLKYMIPVLKELFGVLGVPSEAININLEDDLSKIYDSFEGNKSEKSLEMQFPQIALDWNYDKNGGLLPINITSHSNKKIWWKCSCCGYEWISSVNNRIKRGCPACSNKVVWKGHNDLKTLNPPYLVEWDYDLNTNISPDAVTDGADIKVWWKCSKCGYQWEAFLYHRKQGKGCPYCAKKVLWKGHNDLKSQFPELASEWNDEKNGELRSDEVSVGSSRKVWWICSSCGYEWQATPRNRTSLGSGCPVCAIEKRKKKI